MLHESPYGTVHTVVWEDDRGNPASYPIVPGADGYTYAELRHAGYLDGLARAGGD